MIARGSGWFAGVPRFRERGGRVAVAAMAAAVIGCALPPPPIQGQSSRETQVGSTVAVLPGSQRDSIVALSNAARRQAGVRPLVADTALDRVAMAHARDMAERSYFDHVSPEGHDLARRLGDAGITYSTAGENIAGNASAGGTVRAWLASPGHRANLLSAEFTRVGIGVFRTASSPYTYYVQVLVRSP